MPTPRQIREEAIRRSTHWWYCDNIVNHPEQVGLLRMDFPQVFILICDYAEGYFADFDEFKAGVAEVNFFNPNDRKTADVDDILTEAWNFLSLQEQEEERLAEEREMFDDNDDDW